MDIPSVSKMQKQVAHILEILAIVLLASCRPTATDGRYHYVSKIERFSYESPVPDTAICAVYDKDPEFPGGISAMEKFIQENIEYPRMGLENGQQGIVYVQFAVNKDGSTSNVGIARGISNEFDKAARKVVYRMPEWKPGEYKGEIVRCWFTMPVHFKSG